MAVKKTKSAMQWKTITNVSITNLSSSCEDWSGRGWTVFAILGPFAGGMVIVLKRTLTL